MDSVQSLAPFAAAWSVISPLIATFVTALVLLLAGFLLARGLATAVVYVLKLVQLDKGSKTVKFNTVLEKGEIKKSLTDIIGELCYWAILLITVIGVAKLGGVKIEPAIAKLVMYLGSVVMVAIVLGIGLFLASLIANLVKLVALNFGVDGGKSLARLVYYLVILFTFLAALAQLGVRPSSIIGKLDIVLGAPALAAAIAFGLGCKDMAADFLHNIFKGK
ncbi:MAG: hypothetical protein MUC35_05575 [Candidatus Margulisbacteria bacterium]|jgi:hypothetical protein|nr:hypothetical protein [Candidatus Margulisiibacteriota bacterium]